jgi:hypothetical protein
MVFLPSRHKKRRRGLRTATFTLHSQLAGAYWGESGIPVEWLEGLARKDLIEPLLETLLGGA